MPTSAVSIARAQELADLLGSDLLGAEPDGVDGALAELAGLLRDPDREVLIATAMAVGEAWDERAAVLLLPLVGHPDALVREAVTEALPNGVTSSAVREQVTRALVTLAADPAGEVRSWACFGLAQLEADGPAVRAALIGELQRTDPGAASEALVALAKLGDQVSLPAIEERLGAEPDQIELLDLQAAAELADPALLPLLRRLASAWAGDQDDHVAALDFALARCAEDAAEQAGRIEQALVAAVNAGLGADRPGLEVRTEGDYPRTTLHLLRPDEDEPEFYRIWDEEEPASFDLAGEVTGYLLAAQE